MIPFIKTPTPDIELFNEYLKKSVEASHYTNFGPNHNELKQQMSSIIGSKKLVLTANATLALDGLHTLLANHCTECYLPSFTFPATNQGARVPAYYGSTTGEGPNIGRAQWDTTGEDGYAVTVNPFGSLHAPPKRPKNVKFWIVDNAAGVLTQTQAWLDAGADAVVYSLHATKILSACEGGLVVFSNVQLFEEYSRFINFGFSFNGEVRRSGVQGSNHKMSELSAAWCLASLSSLEHELEKRLANLITYQNFCDDNNVAYIPSYQAFWLLAKSPGLKLTAQEKGVEIRNYYEQLAIYNKSCNVTALFNKNGFCLPTHGGLTEKDRGVVVDFLKQAKKSGLI